MFAGNYNHSQKTNATPPSQSPTYYPLSLTAARTLCFWKIWTIYSTECPDFQQAVDLAFNMMTLCNFRTEKTTGPADSPTSFWYFQPIAKVLSLCKVTDTVDAGLRTTCFSRAMYTETRRPKKCRSGFLRSRSFFWVRGSASLWKVGAGPASWSCGGEGAYRPDKLGLILVSYNLL